MFPPFSRVLHWLNFMAFDKKNPLGRLSPNLGCDKQNSSSDKYGQFVLLRYDKCSPLDLCAVSEKICQRNE